jgi:hypothetical protein
VCVERERVAECIYSWVYVVFTVTGVCMTEIWVWLVLGGLDNMMDEYLKFGAIG